MSHPSGWLLIKLLISSVVMDSHTSFSTIFFVPTRPSGAAAPAAQSTASGVTRRVLVFVLGGVTYSELRAVAELKRELPAGLEVVLGGTSILTARRLINSLRPGRADESQSARPNKASSFIQSALSLA